MKNLTWNMFANIKNGQMLKKPFIIQPRKKFCASFLDILWDEGFILGYKVSNKNFNNFKIFLKYHKGQPVINSIVTITKPSLRVYYKLSQLWKIKINNELLIVSTTKGLLTLENCKKFRVGGEPFLLIR
jgi:small subunit ribosomal protein S8